MEIENPNTAEFVPLRGAFNFEYIPMGAQNLPDNFSFRIDWTKKGDGKKSSKREFGRDHHSSETTRPAKSGRIQGRMGLQHNGWNGYLGGGMTAQIHRQSRTEARGGVYLIGAMSDYYFSQ